MTPSSIGERVIHVASWAARFLFTGEQLNQPVSRLSGGERARILIARLMLEPADVLLLDEPTNDLDIQTLEILEESLLEYRGALVMVTHDRYLLDRVSTVVLGLDGMGAAERFADYSQWDAWQKARKQSMAAESRRDLPPSARIATSSGKKKLSYLDAREFATIEQRIADAEQTLAAKRNCLRGSGDCLRCVAPAGGGGRDDRRAESGGRPLRSLGTSWKKKAAKAPPLLLRFSTNFSRPPSLPSIDHHARRAWRRDVCAICRCSRWALRRCARLQR